MNIVSHLQTGIKERKKTLTAPISLAILQNIRGYKIIVTAPEQSTGDKKLEQRGWGKINQI